MSSNRFILTLRCPDARGIIHAISGALLELEGNVFEQAQYTNESTGVFVMRTRFEANTTDVEGTCTPGIDGALLTDDHPACGERSTADPRHGVAV